MPNFNKFKSEVMAVVADDTELGLVMNLCKSEHLKEFTDEKTRTQILVEMPAC